MPQKPVPLLWWILLVAFVCGGAALIGGFCGSWAGLGYGLIFSQTDVTFDRVVIGAGTNLGIAGSLLAGAIWCAVMIRATLSSNGKQLILRGAILGLTVGLLSTAILHAGLIAFTASFEGFVLERGIITGAIVGPIFGTICGTICHCIAWSRIPPGCRPVDACPPLGNESRSTSQGDNTDAD